MSEDSFVIELKKKLSLIQEEISLLQKSVKDTLDKIEEKQKAVEHIVKLLEIEGEGLNDSTINDFINKSISDFAYEHFSELEEKKPLHYRDLYNGLIAKGIPISGKDPAANLLTHVSRDNRFVRVAPGTYGLQEWGLEPLKKKTTRKRRRK